MNSECLNFDDLNSELLNFDDLNFENLNFGQLNFKNWNLGKLNFQNLNFELSTKENIEFIDVSPKQLVSVAAALIPFLDSINHDETNLFINTDIMVRYLAVSALNGNMDSLLHQHLECLSQQREERRQIAAQKKCPIDYERKYKVSYFLCYTLNLSFLSNPCYFINYFG